MSIFFKARSGKYAVSTGLFLIRFSLGLLFLFAGAKKILHLQDFIKSVQEMNQMNDTAAFVLAFTLPFLQMIFGSLYIIGLFTPIASFVLSLMIMVFLAVLGFRHEELPFSYNIVFLSCTIATLFTGAGLFSFDALIDRKDEKKIIQAERPPVSTSAEQENKNESDAIYVDVKKTSDDEISG